MKVPRWRLLGFWIYFSLYVSNFMKYHEEKAKYHEEAYVVE